jgi:hypothetical protein
MRFATGFWVSLASSSALLDSGSVAAFPAFVVRVTKTAQKKPGNRSYPGSFHRFVFYSGSAPLMAIACSAIRAEQPRLNGAARLSQAYGWRAGPISGVRTGLAIP